MDFIILFCFRFQSLYLLQRTETCFGFTKKIGLYFLSFEKVCMHLVATFFNEIIFAKNREIDFTEKNNTSSFSSMKLLSNAKAIYMATDENVLRLPVSRCQRFRKQRECLNAMDPYCGCNQQINECVATPNNNPRAGYWQQSLLSCPIMSDPVSNALKLSNDF